KQALERTGNTNISIKEFENLNHLFQESETGLPNEYARIEQTFSPKALEYIANWILAQVE
ncbi:MAG TPA: alpha/beta hydrolase, partial [Salinimicrobium sp.]|nr:alpha/beta hydrolase [Salinimicrobium sp.]